MFCFNIFVFWFDLSFFFLVFVMYPCVLFSASVFLLWFVAFFFNYVCSLVWLTTIHFSACDFSLFHSRMCFYYDLSLLRFVCVYSHYDLSVFFTLCVCLFWFNCFILCICIFAMIYHCFFSTCIFWDFCITVFFQHMCICFFDFELSVCFNMYFCYDLSLFYFSQYVYFINVRFVFFVILNYQCFFQ